MYGIEAITAHNGWAQALTGAIIVMSGLTILSIVISFLPKLAAFFEADQKPSVSLAQPPLKQVSQRPSLEPPVTAPLQDLSATADRYAGLTEPLGDSFQLIELYRLFDEKDLPHPHLTIKSFREAGLILPAGEGRFAWKLGSK